MPSPFPGMDPYLESPRHFHGFHNKFLAFLEVALQPLLPEPYIAEGGERVWIDMSYRYVEPDVSVLREHAKTTSDEGTGGLALASAAIPVVVSVEVIPNDEHRETFVEIFYDREEERRLVTAIELLSPANKTPGEQGRDLYLRKQRQIRAGQANLVEIDLLRAGVHSTAVPREQATKQAGPFDYHASVYRFHEANRFYVYPIRLTDRLPVISIPLLPGDGDVSLDLQAVFNRCYDEGAYRRKVHYEFQTLEPPLSSELNSWAQTLLESTKK